MNFFCDNRIIIESPLREAYGNICGQCGTVSGILFRIILDGEGCQRGWLTSRWPQVGNGWDCVVRCTSSPLTDVSKI